MKLDVDHALLTKKDKLKWKIDLLEYLEYLLYYF